MTVLRSYGWRPSLPDMRDVMFSAPAGTLEALPPRVDLSEPTLPAPFEPSIDQGSLGSCGPCTAAADLIYAQIRQDRIADVRMPSKLYIYWNTRAIMGTVASDSGVDNRSLLKALEKYGWCDETEWPYNVSRFTVRPSEACYTQAAGRKIGQYLSVPQTLEQMQGCLAGGDTFIFGFTVYQSLENNEVDRTGVIPMPRRGERAVGGHDVLIVGYDNSTRHFKLKNSWGGWGIAGYGWIPYEYAISPNLSGDFWTVRSAGWTPPTPPPPPPPPPSPPVPSTNRITLVSDSPIRVVGETQ